MQGTSDAVASLVPTLRSNYVDDDINVPVHMKTTSCMSIRRATALILLALRKGHVYGFDIMDATGLASGSVYPALRRLEGQGWVVSHWEEDLPDARGPGRPTRRVYSLTEVGEKHVAEAHAKVSEAHGAARDLLSPEGTG
jgi:PadR family transcriptional regulator, regulatory protein PadR